MSAILNLSNFPKCPICTTSNCSILILNSKKTIPPNAMSTILSPTIFYLLRWLLLWRTSRTFIVAIAVCGQDIHHCQQTAAAMGRRNQSSKCDLDLRIMCVYNKNSGFKIKQEDLSLYSYHRNASLCAVSNGTRWKRQSK